MDINTTSYYINPNTRTLTTNINNTVVSSKEVYDFMSDKLIPVENMQEVLMTPINLAEKTSVNTSSNSINLAEGTSITVNGGYVLTVKKQGVEVSGGNFYNQVARQEAEDMAGALSTLLRNAGGTMNTIAHSSSEYETMTENISKVMSYFGIDTSKAFTINGMKYRQNEKGYFESESSTEAQKAYEQLKSANKTYEFADKRTKKQILHMSDYYLSTTPATVKEAWQKTLEETGINPFPSGYTSTLSQLSMEQDFLTKGNDNIFGDSIESSIKAVQNIIDRVDNPLGTITKEQLANIYQEKIFYDSLLSKLHAL